MVLYGFKLSSRVQPRQFKGLLFKLDIEISEQEFNDAYPPVTPRMNHWDRFFENEEGVKYRRCKTENGSLRFYKEQTDPELLIKRAVEIGKDMLLVNSDNDKNLIPIYDYKGNLLWPVQISHDEIVKMKAGDMARDASN